MKPLITVLILILTDFIVAANTPNVYTDTLKLSTAKFERPSISLFQLELPKQSVPFNLSLIEVEEKFDLLPIESRIN